MIGLFLVRRFGVDMDSARVLIADGDHGLQQQLLSRLHEVDVHSDCVSNVPAAMDKLAGLGYGLVVVDVGLKGGNVEQVIARIASIPALERPVVVILAGNPSAARSLDVEVVQIVLRKPVSVGQVVDLISNCVRSTSRNFMTAPPQQLSDTL